MATASAETVPTGSSMAKVRTLSSSSAASRDPLSRSISGPRGQQPPADPPVAEYPSQQIRQGLPPTLWASCLDTWCAITEYFICHPGSEFEQAKQLIRFLQSYVSLTRYDDTTATAPSSVVAEDYEEIRDPMARLLRRNVFVLLYRQYMSCSSVSNREMLWGFMRLYARGNHFAIQKLVKHLGIACSPHVTVAGSNGTTEGSDVKEQQDRQMTDRLRLFVLDRISKGTFTISELHTLQVFFEDPDIVRSWVTSTLWIAALRSIVARVESAGSRGNVQVTPSEAALKVAYISLVALAKVDPAAAGQTIKELLLQLPPPSDVQPGELLPALVVRTKLLPRLRNISERSSEGGNSHVLDGMIVSLETVKLKLTSAITNEIVSRFRKMSAKGTDRRQMKNKKKQIADALVNVLDIQEARKVQEIKEIFPLLSEKYIITLLSAKENSVEQVLSYLVENNVAMDVPDGDGKVVTRNMTDVPSDDEERRYQNLEFAPGTVFIGKRPGLDADEMLAQGTSTSEKQKIFDTLRLFYDEEEDERDDTYDDQDASTHMFEPPETEFPDSVDTSSSAAMEKKNIQPQRPTRRFPLMPQDYADMKKTKTELRKMKEDEEYRMAENPNEAYLWSIFSGDESVFATDKRGTKFRDEMKKRTSWTDEQIEGWAKVLLRDTKFRKSLEAKYIFRGNTPIVSSSSYDTQYVPDDEIEIVEEDSDTSDNDAQPKKITKRSRDILSVYQVSTEPKKEKLWGSKTEKRRLAKLQEAKERDERIQTLAVAGSSARMNGGVVNARGAGVSGSRGGYGGGAARGGHPAGGWSRDNHNRRDQRAYKMRQGMSNNNV
ncbi:uncharacterized protein V1518DRAFT_426633 [Limtongia smithiae]|uniref:uncharacterized protein n=1 Tax=Limtongia smithiae TaxID=1125753 RepID=UPI0034CE10DC